MKLLVPFSLAAVSASSYHQLAQKSAEYLDGLRQFENFKLKYNKSYASEAEENYRAEIFMEQLQKFKLHNQKPNKTYTLGVNQFTDLTFEEFKNLRLMSQPKGDLKLNGDGESLSYPEEPWELECPKRFEGADISTEFVEHLDWRDAEKNPLNLVADVGVKNQASCGSCYIFSAVSVMEASLCMNGDFDCTNWSGLSEQQILDCATYDETQGDRLWERSHGCSGGWQSDALQYVYLAGGITSAENYPYTSGTRDFYPNKYNMGHCSYTPETRADWMAEHSVASLGRDICGTINKNGEHNADTMKQAVFSKGPVAIGMYVGDNFRSVVDGIYMPETANEGDCPRLLETGINHALTVVGYGQDEDAEGNAMPYWLVKNSWGTDFAMDGYVKVARGVNACGIEGNTLYAETRAA